jgi:transposase-like protein
MAESKDIIKQIRKATRRKFSSDEKIRIVLEGLRGETSISEICRREGIAASVYYKWSKSLTVLPRLYSAMPPVKRFAVLSWKTLI